MIPVQYENKLKGSGVTGGDNSNGAIGSFYEGVIASGVTSAATDDEIQKNIVAVQYKTHNSGYLAN